MTLLYTLIVPVELPARPPLALGSTSTERMVYFQGTEYELSVYKIRGAERGNTLMIIGGIQGDEPGGYLAADLYADMSLKKGNLIVVPRANFPSILKNRRAINGDMNRRFVDTGRIKSASGGYEDRVVSILKELMAESDILLNLHEGSGFYSERWESPLKNRRRFGQSIITDSDVAYSVRYRRDLDLKGIAQKIIEEINQNIAVAEYRFKFNNTRTASPDTIHPEQRRSATYFALTNFGIPAFGIETSKEIKDIKFKVKCQTLAINAFMKEFEIIPENPKIYLDPPVLKYLVVSVNGATPLVVHNGKTLTIKKGDTIEISHAVANYERGLNIDILGVGGGNDLGRPVLIDRGTLVVVKKDAYECGRVYLKVSDTDSRIARAVSDTPPSFKYFILNVNGTRYALRHQEAIQITAGDRVEIVDALTEGIAKNMKVNLIGFIGNKKYNDGEDRGYKIDTARDLMKGYSIEKDGKKYRIVAKVGNKTIAEMFLLVTH
ncbi:MAG: M14/M99 family metallopeptidase [Nitrospirota bacterium]